MNTPKKLKIFFTSIVLVILLPWIVTIEGVPISYLAYEFVLEKMKDYKQEKLREEWEKSQKERFAKAVAQSYHLAQKNKKPHMQPIPAEPEVPQITSFDFRLEKLTAQHLCHECVIVLEHCPQSYAGKLSRIYLELPNQKLKLIEDFYSGPSGKTRCEVLDEIGEMGPSSVTRRFSGSNWSAFEVKFESGIVSFIIVGDVKGEVSYKEYFLQAAEYFEVHEGSQKFDLISVDEKRGEFTFKKTMRYTGKSEVIQRSAETLLSGADLHDL